MRTSYYNFVQKNEQGKYVIYNSRTGSMVVLDERHYQALKDLENEGIEIQDKDYEQGLSNCGLIINNDIDELELIRMNMQKSRFASTLMSLVIAPTKDCNFRCSYCYESGCIEPVYMDEQTQNNITSKQYYSVYQNIYN